MNISHKLAEAMYAKTAGSQGPQDGQGGPGAGQQSGGQASGKKDDDVVDADFEEVKK
jgi:molecular chaperone DnaK